MERILIKRHPRANHWKGGRHVTDGYAFVLQPDHPNAKSGGYILEHRLIMSNFLGRPLRKNEVVHHKNENGLDNRLCNLELMDASEHKRHHNLGKIPAWILERIKSIPIQKCVFEGCRKKQRSKHPLCTKHCNCQRWRVRYGKRKNIYDRPTSIL